MNNIIFKKVVTSTNTEIRQYQDLLGEFDFVAMYSDVQTEGRGRRNRLWESGNHNNIYLSIMFNKNVPNLNMITIASGLCVCKALEKNFDLDFKIKWPNDIFVNHKKLGGILVETSFLGKNIDYFIVGIGINLNNKNFDNLENIATSIYLETGKQTQRDTLINDIIKNVNDGVLKLSENSFNMEEYEKRLNHLNKKVLLGNEEVVSKGVDSVGNLIVQKENSEIIKVNFQEISIFNL